MKLLNTVVSYQTVKENIGMIVLVPTMLGGIWQLLELAMIGTPYLRFFSLTQLVPDGLLILFTFGLMFSVCWMLLKDWFKYLYRLWKTPAAEKVKPTPAQKKGIFLKDPRSTAISRKNAGISLAIILTILTILIVFLLPELLTGMKFGKVWPLIVWILAAFYISLACVFLKMIIESLLQASGRIINLLNPVVDTIFAMVLPALAISLFVFSIKIMVAFHQSFALPEDFKNSMALQQRITSKSPATKSAEIVYFNDKYIFVQVTDTSRAQYVEVYKFDDFTAN